MFNRYYTLEDESLSDVANKFNLNVNDLKELNGLFYDGALRKNTEIKLPAESSNYFNYYTIEKGDTVYGIARKYNINPTLLVAMNGLNNADYIYPGQELIIPKSNYSYYLTAEGDTLEMVAKAFKKPVQKLIEENKTIYLLPDQLIVGKK